MIRAFAAVLAAMVLSLTVAACGEDEKKTPVVTFEMSGSGKNLTLSGPDTLEAGLVEIQFTNSAEGDHGLQLVRVDGDRTGADVQKAGDAWGDKGEPLPDWLHIEGGFFVAGSWNGDRRTETRARQVLRVRRRQRHEQGARGHR